MIFSFSYSQTLLWSDDFESTTTDWDLTISSGANDANANIWTISDDEGGVAPPGCGVATNGNKTLHVTCQGVTCVGTGAVYYSGDGGSFGLPGITNKRAALTSPIITTGQTQLEIVFDWIGVGQANIDFAELEYSTDGGTTWNAIWSQIPGNICGGGQGEWKEETVTLPLATENQADLRFAFNWENDNDATGSDPSFAVNDLRLFTNATPTGPIADFTTPSFSVCENDCIGFTDASTGTNISAWNWTFTGATTPNSTMQNPTNICYPTAGTYDVTLSITDDNGTDNTTYQLNVSSCTSPLSAAFATDTLTVCVGDCISFTDLSAGEPTLWNWTFDGAEPPSSSLQNPTNICFDSAGVFDVTLSISDGITSDQIINSITVLDLPEINGYGDTSIALGGAAVLLAEPIDPGVLFWDPADDIDCPTCLEVIATPLLTTTYYPSLIGLNGCTGRDTVLVLVEFKEIVEVPSAFSPNGDGNNDFVHVLGLGITSIDFKIYNRFGQMVFSTTDIEDGWDGTMNGELLNQGVFVYTLEFELIDGSNGEKSGNITLVK
jgi:gliding motility-associated-like protein